MSSAGDKRRPDRGGQARRPEPDGSGAGAGSREPKFFLAVFQSGVREARIYRAYPDEDGVSFLYAGPAPMFLDVELARSGVRGDWKAQAAESLKTGLVKASGGALVVAGLVIAIIGRVTRWDWDLSRITDIIGLLLV